MNHGLKRLEKLPVCLRLIREIHERLLRGVRGSERRPGQFRKTQNWIGPDGCTLATATFVPPPVPEMERALDNFEKFLQDTESLPALVQCALAHAQFETIHPFLDGNGRIGRLLITLLLCQRQILRQPLLYLSYFFKAHRTEYYDRLMAIRNDGDWEAWLKFFLRGVYEVSQAATATARAILGMREAHRRLVSERVKTGGTAGSVLLDYLFQNPMTTVRLVEKHLDCSYVTASRLVEQFAEHGLLKETTGGQRNRRWRYQPYLKWFEPSLVPPSASETTARDGIAREATGNQNEGSRRDRG